MKLYAGIDLHSTNNFLAIIDETDKVVYQKRMKNDLSLILENLAFYQTQLEGIVIESTYNWYWLADGLQVSGYQVHLANPTAIQVYSGLKYTDDKTDALWLAKLLRLGLLRTGYIYPREERGLRELLRRRLVFVRQQTMNILGIQAMLLRYENIKFSANQLKRFRNNEADLFNCIKDEPIRVAVKSQLKLLYSLMDEIAQLEKLLLAELKANKLFCLLKKIPGIGPILAMTILLETGNINRFKRVGNFSSYCRCVTSQRISNEKRKGKNNSKNGNVYLGWAFIEAAHYAIRHYGPIQSYYQRKLRKTKRVIALKTVAHKLARATYFILRDRVEFNMKKLFN